MKEQEDQKQVTRMDSTSQRQQHIDAGNNEPASATVSDDQVSKLTDDEIVERTVSILRALNDLKEDVLHRSTFQPQFDAGMLSAAMSVLEANLPDDDPRVVAEHERQMNERLARALKSTGTGTLSEDRSDRQ
jgi:hypothetical protein